MKTYRIIGLMSGTSLDGLDIAHVSFSYNKDRNWDYQLLHAITVPFEPNLLEKLKHSTELSAFHFCMLDKELGDFFAQAVLDFISKNNINPNDIDSIASHGQTIFHQPDNGLTTQIGCGCTLAIKTGIKVINDFRKKDVILGGQGAPLVPIGDFLLFGKEAEAFLNIGGFSNISYQKQGKTIAYDICPGNLPLNLLANNKGLAYDQNGNLARSGEINFFLLDLLNNLDFYIQNAPKSLGIEWLELHFYPLIKFDKDIENNLRTVIEHVAYQIGNELNKQNINSVYITGGGAFNGFLLERIKHYFTGEMIIPNPKIIAFKEAIIFALLGALKLENIPYCLSSVTGASRDNCGGLIHLPH